MGVSDRISLILNHYNIKAGEMAVKIGVTPATISNLKNEKTGMSLQIAQKIKQCFPELDFNWVLHGKGNMIQSTDSQINSFNCVHSNPITGEIFPLESDNDAENSSDNRITTNNDVCSKQSTSSQLEINFNNNKTEQSISERTNSKESMPLFRTIEKIIIYYSDKTFEEYDMTKCKL